MKVKAHFLSLAFTCFLSWKNSGARPKNEETKVARNCGAHWAFKITFSRSNWKSQKVYSANSYFCVFHATWKVVSCSNIISSLYQLRNSMKRFFLRQKNYSLLSVLFGLASWTEVLANIIDVCRARDLIPFYLIG